MGLGLALAVILVSCADSDGEEFRKAWLNEVEDLAESLANDLLALSVAARERDLEAVGGYFAETVRSAPLPTTPGSSEPVVKWIERHDWVAASGDEAALPRERFLEQFESLLDHFGELEDVRFKVKGAELDPERPGESSARLKAFIIGRDEQGRREWPKTMLRVEAIKEHKEGPWRIRRFRVDSMQSKVASVDLFSEIALPAGVSAIFPPFAVGANSGFVSHGAAAGDINGDGLLDIAATGVERNYLYLNLGDGRFRDVADESLVAHAPPGSGVLFLDYDNDGDSDLFLAVVGTQILLENRWIPDGEIKFLDVSEKSGVSVPAVGFSALGADVNGDGLTDVYVASYNRYGTVMPNAWHRATNGTPNLLLLNRGEGTFEEAGEAWGIAS